MTLQMMHARLLRLPPLLMVVLATLGFRFALTVPQWIGAHSFVLETGVPPNIPLDFVSFPGLWARWDSGNYLAMVIQGYTDPMQRVFMPLYPILMWVGALGHFEWILWSGLLISWGAFFGAVALLWNQVKQDHGEAVANIMIILLNVFPLLSNGASSRSIPEINSRLAPSGSATSRLNTLICGPPVFA